MDLVQRLLPRLMPSMMHAKDLATIGVEHGVRAFVYAQVEQASMNGFELLGLISILCCFLPDLGLSHCRLVYHRVRTQVAHSNQVYCLSTTAQRIETRNTVLESYPPRKGARAVTYLCRYAVRSLLHINDSFTLS